jgi:DNA-binding transcriptional LysR family regulator
MIDKLELLLYLARERHFGKAAQAAGVSQPTLSSAVKSLEDQFGVLIVERGSRFRGFTSEGERILDWARRITGDARSMRQEIAAMRRAGGGELRLGAVPTVLPVVTDLTVPFGRSAPDVRFSVMSMTSNRILQGLENLEIDVGLSYLGEESLGRFRGIPLYRERYALLVAPGSPFASRQNVTWREAGQVPLCQLSADMQNRRLVDRHLREAGAEPNCTLESNSMLILYAHVRSGGWASIIPVRFADALERPGRLRAIPLVDPTVSHEVGMILPDRDVHPPLVAQFLRVATRSFAAGAATEAEAEASP